MISSHRENICFGLSCSYPFYWGELWEFTASAVGGKGFEKFDSAILASAKSLLSLENENVSIGDVIVSFARILLEKKEKPPPQNFVGGKGGGGGAPPGGGGGGGRTPRGLRLPVLAKFWRATKLKNTLIFVIIILQVKTSNSIMVSIYVN